MSVSKEVAQVAWNMGSKDTINTNTTSELLAAFCIASYFTGIM